MSTLPTGLVEAWDFLADTGDRYAPIGTADAIPCLGSANLGTARRGAALFANGVAPIVVVSGGAPWVRRSRVGRPHATEADAFAHELQDRGVPAGAILWDRRSTNTGENARFAVDALEAAGIPPRRLVVVCFPTLVRRAAATFALVHPDIAVRAVASFDTFDDFEESPQRAVALVVAEVRRLVTYPELGLIAPVDVPHWVRETAARLSGDLPNGDQSDLGTALLAAGPPGRGGFPLSP